MSRLLQRARSLPAWLGPLALAAVAILAVYWPLFAGQVIHHRDVARWLVPARWFWREALLHGEWPFWNPDVGLGLSALSNPLYGVFYPPNLLLLVGPLPNLAVGWMLLHVLLGGVGAALLVRGAGGGAAATVTAALTWMLSNFVCAQWTVGLLLPAGAWIPWVAVGFVRLARAAVAPQPGGLRRATGLLALPVAFSLLLGEIFVAQMAIGFGLAAATGVLLAERKRPLRAVENRQALRRFAGAAAVAVAIAGALAAPSLLPMVLSARGTERAAPLAAEAAEGWSVHPQHLLDLVVAGGHGLAWERHADAPWTRRVLDGNPLSMRFYLGGSVMALVLLAFGRRRGDDPQGRRRTLALAYAAAAVGSILLALGRYLPVHRMVRALVRSLAYMRAPEKYLLVLVAAVAVLAGLGATRLATEKTPPRTRVLVLAALLAVLAIAAPALFPPELALVMRTGAVHALIGTLAVAAVLGFADRAAATAALVVLAVVALDLGAAAKRTLRFGPASMIDGRPPLVEVIRGSLPASAGGKPRLYRSPTVQDAIARAGVADPEYSMRETQRDNLSVLHGIAILPGYDAATPVSLTRLLDLKRRDVLRLLGVDFALLSDATGGAPTARPPGLTPLFAPAPGSLLYRVTEPLPRVYRAGRSLLLANTPVAEQLLVPDVLAGRAVLLDPRDRPPALDEGPAPEDTCRLLAYAGNRLEASCHGARPGLAVFVEQWAPGWHATVNGSRAPVLRANTVARAVPVPAGDAHVVLTFSPPGLRAGLLFATLGLALLVGCLARRRNSPRASAG
jgi:hypothetical protein